MVNQQSKSDIQSLHNYGNLTWQVVEIHGRSASRDSRLPFMIQPAVRQRPNLWRRKSRRRHFQHLSSSFFCSGSSRFADVHCGVTPYLKRTLSLNWLWKLRNVCLTIAGRSQERTLPVAFSLGDESAEFLLVWLPGNKEAADGCWAVH